MSERVYRKGDAVRANRVILDVDSYGDYYIHAIPGTFGVVNEHGQEHPLVDVTWADGNQCTVHAEDIDPYDGYIVRVAEPQEG